MPYRKFTDENGKCWEVWAVPTSLAERRVGDRRKSEGWPPGFDERRKGEERRTVKQTRARLTSEYQYGWLVFECPPERRRLTPVPDGWEELDDPRLMELLASARPVS